ncbi:restriction endonuclease subunit S [uncultured Pseudoxanthomonas sp.]|uniref:restriction endonuclease subunit S n=1 Tax=uncultured Pseudoxanthomonas sp. TaxID=281701 RepID=UPI0026077A60|nr:restriction endonuclease subunit S [uncultured Pseudoxanthomonas sp.]
MTTAQVRVGEISEQVRGVTYGKGDASDTAQDGYLPILRAGNITETGAVFDDLVYVPAGHVAPKQILRSGDVLIAASSGSLDVVGKAAPILSDYEGAFGAFCKVLRPNQARVNPSYFAHFFKTAEYRRIVSGLAAGANINNLRNEHLDDLLIPLPPLPEQQRIAAILDKADALRTKRREALTQLGRLATSIFLEMFGDPAKNPKGWPVRALKELGRVSTGGTPPSAKEGMFGGDIPFVTPGDLESGKPVRRTVTEAGAQEAGTIRAGASLVCCIGATIGKMDAALVRSSFNQQLNAVEWFEDCVDDSYGLASLKFFKPTIVAWGASTTLPILKKSSFEKISIPTPPVAMQREFARCAREVSRIEEKLRSALERDTELFSSLQSKAFQGSL